MIKPKNFSYFRITLLLVCTSIFIACQSQPGQRNFRKTQLTLQLIPFVSAEIKKRFYPTCTDVKLVSPIDLNPPHLEAIETFHSGIVWSETWKVDACGSPKVHHFDIELVAHPQGEGGFVPVFYFTPTMNFLTEEFPEGDVYEISKKATFVPPFQSIASSEMTEVVLQNIEKYHASCKSIKIENTPVLTQTPDFRTKQKTGNLPDGLTWSETWLMNVCKIKYFHHIDFYSGIIRGRKAFLIKVYPEYLK